MTSKRCFLVVCAPFFFLSSAYLIVNTTQLIHLSTEDRAEHITNAIINSNQSTSADELADNRIRTTERNESVETNTQESGNVIEKDDNADNTNIPEPGSRDSSPVSLLNNQTAATTEIHPLDVIKVPFPIFVASLPKSGTTSTARYFYCGNIWTAHTFVNTETPTNRTLSNGTIVAVNHRGENRAMQMRVGRCFYENIKVGRPPFEDCGRYHVWSDMGHPRGTPCFYPSVHGLDAFYEYYPNATILLVTRNATAWANSVMKWRQGMMLKKWKRCEKFPRRGPKRTKVSQLEQFYEWHANNIRQFAKDHPSLTYVEHSLENPDIGFDLQRTIGINASCFGHHNKAK